MDKDKIKQLKLQIQDLAQDICNEMDGVNVDIQIETWDRSSMSGHKSTVVTDVRVSFNEEI